MDSWNKDHGNVSGDGEAREIVAEAECGQVLDLEKAVYQMGGDEDLLKEVLQIFMDDMPRKLYELHNACESRDRERMRRAAHSIKGASANIAAECVQAVALEIEKMAPEADLDSIGERINTLEAEMSKLETAIDLAVSR